MYRKSSIHLSFLQITELFIHKIRNSRRYESVGRGFESLSAYQTVQIRTFHQLVKGSDLLFILHITLNEARARSCDLALFFFLGVLLCFCRVALGLHFVRDVVVGGAIGIITSLIGGFILI